MISICKMFGHRFRLYGRLAWLDYEFYLGNSTPAEAIKESGMSAAAAKKCSFETRCSICGEKKK